MSAAPARPAGEHAAPPESLMEMLRGIWRELPGLISDRVELLSLELHRAGLALLQIVVLGIAFSVLSLTAWLLLWGLVITALTMAGLHWMVAFMMALVVHLLLALWAVARVKRLLPLLRLPATRRRLMFPAALSPAQPPAPPSSASPQAPPHDDRLAVS